MIGEKEEKREKRQEEQEGKEGEEREGRVWKSKDKNTKREKMEGLRPRQSLRSTTWECLGWCRQIQWIREGIIDEGWREDSHDRDSLQVVHTGYVINIKHHKDHFSNNNPKKNAII